jgi:hypothetical protein
MKHGRPTISERKQIQELISSYYENNIEARTVSKKTGINYKTILKYYKIWNDELIHSNNENFLRRIKIAKERNIQILDNMLISLGKEQDRIKFQLDHAVQIGDLFHYEKLHSLNLKTTEQLMKIFSLKINLIGTPTADIIIKQKEAQNV